MNGHVLNSGKLQFTGGVPTENGTKPAKVNSWPDSNSIPTPTIKVTSTPSTSSNPNIVAPKGTVKKAEQLPIMGTLIGRSMAC